MVKSPFQIIILEWKKFAIIAPIAAGVVWYTYDLTMTRQLMKYNCSKAALIGDEKLPYFNAKTKHVTVLLNPTAGKGKTKRLYTKWVEPLLHLSGMRVSLVETDGPEQPYGLMKIMSDCDGVAIVGGDGTVSEAINGYLERPESQGELMARPDFFPLGIMPTGKTNSIAKDLYKDIIYRNKKELLIQSTMQFIEQCKATFVAKEMAKSAQEARKSERRPLSYKDKVTIGSVFVLVTAVGLLFGMDSGGAPTPATN